MTPELLLAFFAIGIGLHLAVALASLALRKQEAASNLVAQVGAMVAALFTGTVALAILGGKPALDWVGPTLFPGFTLSLHVDGLSAFFVAVISLISLASALYGTRYVKHLFGHADIGLLGLCTHVFLASMLIVVSASSVMGFLLAWELMSLSSYLLVTTERHREDVVKAGWVYLIMTQVGTAFVILSLLLLAHGAGSMDFAGIRAGAAALSPALKATIFALGLVGFGTKAGIIPLHVWLPEAHPAAPSHISALLSGVMIKTAIYAFVRLTFDLLPPLPVGWGLLVLVLASISAVVGVLYALAEHDLKRLLAYHSVENIGIILMGVGAALVFRTLDMPVAATVALVAGLFHVLNHAVFKALLFLGAGAVASETGTRNIEDYGGLIKRMPWTAATFLVGAVAISGLPPFNGFASEWLTYQSIVGSLAALSPAARAVAILTVAALALTGGLAAACFVKAFGITFLARPRSEHATHAEEVGVEMRISMGFLAALCLLLGIASPFIVQLLTPVADGLAGSSMGVVRTGYEGVMLGDSTLALPLVALALAVLGALAWVVTRLVLGTQRETVYTTWDCGNDLGPRMEYTGTAFARSLLVVFKGLLRPSKQVDIEYHDAEQRFLTKSLRADSGIISFAHKLIYTPLDRVVSWIARQISRMQNGSIHAYLFYILLVLVGLVAFAL